MSGSPRFGLGRPWTEGAHREGDGHLQDAAREDPGGLRGLTHTGPPVLPRWRMGAIVRRRLVWELAEEATCEQRFLSLRRDQANLMVT